MVRSAVMKAVRAHRWDSCTSEKDVGNMKRTRGRHLHSGWVLFDKTCVMTAQGAVWRACDPPGGWWTFPTGVCSSAGGFTVNLNQYFLLSVSVPGLVLLSHTSR